MTEHFCGVRGDLLRWARQQQGLSTRSLKDRGGPSLGYMSEVENRKKSEVRSDVLVRWTQLLGITETFARGQIPRYHYDPAACRGLAADVGSLIMSDTKRNWASLSPLERCRQVLVLIAQKSRQLPPTVLAYVLDVELDTLVYMINGTHPIMREQMRALADLTSLPEGFFKYGVLMHGSQGEIVLQEMLTVLQPAVAAGMTVSELHSLIQRWQDRETETLPGSERTVF